MKEGDIAYISYDAWMLSTEDGAKGEAKADNDRLFETTDKATAEKEGIHEENRRYGPVAILVGKGMLYKPLEKAVSETEAGKDGEVVVAPADGAGERDPRLVQTIPLNEFLKNEIDPVQGMMVTVKNRSGVVMFRSPGRVVVDFNSPLAGKRLRYKFKVERLAATDEERVKGIIDLNFGGADDFQVKLHGDEIVVSLPDKCRFDYAWFEGKLRVVTDLRKMFPEKSVTFSETFKAEPKAEEKPAEGAHEHKAGEEHSHKHGEAAHEHKAKDSEDAHEKKPEGEAKPKKARKKAEHKDKAEPKAE